MDITKVRDAIKLEFEADGMPGNNEINEALNECIRNINSRTEGKRVLLTITGASGSTTWGGTTSVWGDTTTTWSEAGRFINDFSFDSDNNCLTIPYNVKSIKRLYIDDIEQIPKPYNKMINTYPADEDFFYLLYGTRITADAGFFTQIDNKIYFQKDLGSETSVIKVECQIDYPDISDDADYPNYFKQYLISNSIKILASRSRNIISQNAHERHIIETQRSFNFILNGIEKIEQAKNFDIW